jgi:hypothetical protein
MALAFVSVSKQVRKGATLFCHREDFLKGGPERGQTLNLNISLLSKLLTLLG